MYGTAACIGKSSLACIKRRSLWMDRGFYMLTYICIYDLHMFFASPRALFDAQKILYSYLLAKRAYVYMDTEP